MKTNSLLIRMVSTFIITLLVSSVVTLLWNILVDKSGANVDWKTAFMLAIVMGIVLPFSYLKGKAT